VRKAEDINDKEWGKKEVMKSRRERERERERTTASNDLVVP
jgi:hypothetical protein